MGLEDRIQEEMYIDTESLLDEEFDRAKRLFNIYEDNTIALADGITRVSAKSEILVYLTARQYIAEADDDADSAMGYEFFYDQFDKDESTVRRYFGDLVDDGLVQKTDEQGYHRLVTERLSDVIDRVEAEIDEE